MKYFKLLFLLVMFFMFATILGCSGTGESGTSASKGSKITSKLAGSEIQVSGATDDQQNPQVVYLADKKVYFVVWEDWKDRNLATTDLPADPAKFTGADIWGKFLNVDGTSCGSDFVITNKLSGNQTLPSAAYRPGDKLLVAWQDSVGTTTSGYIRYSAITSIPSAATCATSVPTVSAPVQVGFNHFMQYNSNTLVPDTVSFTIAGDPTGGADVTGGAVLVPYVFPRSIVITGSYPAEDGVLATAGSATPVNIQDDGMGKLIGSGASGTINYMTGKLDVTLINEVDTGATATFTISYNSLGQTATNMPETLKSRKSPKVNFDSANDHFSLTWVESRNVTSYASVLCFNVAPVTWLTGDSTFLGYLYLDPALNPKANSLAIANADVMRSETTSSMKLVSTSRTPTLETYVYDFFTNFNNPNQGSDNTSLETIFVWEGVRNTATLTCTLDVTTGTIKSEFKTAAKDDGKLHIYGIFDKELILNTATNWIDFENTGAGTNPSLAFDYISNPRKFLVAWEDNRGGSNTKVFGQLINSGGGLYNNNRMLSFQDSAGTGTNDKIIANSRQTKPFVTYDAVNQRYFVMWQDERNSSTSMANIDLYGQYVNPDGSLSGTNYAISSNPSNQLAPSIAYDSFTKQFLAVWKDARNINPPGTSASDIYGQIFTIGQPQMTLLTATTPAEQLVPAVHDFGAVNTGTTVTWPLLVKNTGDTTLNMNAIIKQPTNPFTIRPTNAVTLAPGSSATYTVSYTPTSSGTYNSSFTLESDGGNQTVALSATGVGLNPLSITDPVATSLQDTVVNVPYSVQLVASGGYTPLTWSAVGLPAGLTINSSGLISGSATVLGNYTIVATVTDGTSPTPVVFTKSYTIKVVDPNSLRILTNSINGATTGVLYDQPLTAAGGSGPLSWSIVGGPFNGLSIAAATGVISGIPAADDVRSFTVQVMDSLGTTSTKTFSITSATNFVISTLSISDMLANDPVSFTMAASGGSGGYSWDLKNGGFPGGLTLNKDGGTISGTPTLAGNYSVVIRATDIDSGIQTFKQFNFSVTDPGTTTTNTLLFVDQLNAVLANNTFSLGTALKSTSVSKRFYLSNGGITPITISSVTFSDPAFSAVLPIGSSILSGVANVVPVNVTFLPLTAKDYSATMTIKDSTGASSILNLFGIGATVSVVLETGSTGSVTSFSSLTPAQLPISSKPATFTVSTATQMRITGAVTGGTVNVNATFESLPTNPVFYNVNGNTWTLITPTPTVSGATVTFAVMDNGAQDFDLANGVIVNTIAAGTTGAAGGTTTPGGGTVSSSSSGGSSSGCFIATAAYGSYLDPHVMVLRHFRDEVLLQSTMGIEFVKFYYKHSPPIADYIAQHDSLRTIFRLALTPLIFAVKYPLGAALLFGFAGVWFIRRRLSLKVQSEMVQQAR